jgi:hypothetical protein
MMAGACDNEAMPEPIDPSSAPVAPVQAKTARVFEGSTDLAARLRDWRDADPASPRSQTRIKRLRRVAWTIFFLAICGFLIDGANRPANPYLVPAPQPGSPALITPTSG